MSTSTSPVASPVHHPAADPLVTVPIGGAGGGLFPDSSGAVAGGREQPIQTMRTDHWLPDTGFQLRLPGLRRIALAKEWTARFALLAGLGLLIAGTVLWANAGTNAEQLRNAKILLGSGAGAMLLGSAVRYQRLRFGQVSQDFYSPRGRSLVRVSELLAVAALATMMAGVAQWVHGASPESMLLGQSLFLVGAASATTAMAVSQSIKSGKDRADTTLVAVTTGMAIAAIASLILWKVLPNGSVMSAAGRITFAATTPIALLSSCIVCVGTLLARRARGDD
jgi:hypothetical protein